MIMWTMAFSTLSAASRNAVPLTANLAVIVRGGGNVRVLVACEESQTVANAFREAEHEAISCDLVECSGGHPEYHLRVDALEILKIKWDMIIAHPPCTYMSKAGARWMYPKAGELSEERYALAMKAKAFFMRFLMADCPRVCVENPRPLKVVGLPPLHRSFTLRIWSSI